MFIIPISGMHNWNRYIRSWQNPYMSSQPYRVRAIMVGKAEWKPQVDIWKCVIYPNFFVLLTTREVLNHIKPLHTHYYQFLISLFVSLFFVLFTLFFSYSSSFFFPFFTFSFFPTYFILNVYIVYVYV